MQISPEMLTIGFKDNKAEHIFSECPIKDVCFSIPLENMVRSDTLDGLLLGMTKCKYMQEPQRGGQRHIVCLYKSAKRGGEDAN